MRGTKVKQIKAAVKPIIILQKFSMETNYKKNANTSTVTLDKCFRAVFQKTKMEYKKDLSFKLSINKAIAEQKVLNGLKYRLVNRLMA